MIHNELKRIPIGRWLLPDRANYGLWPPKTSQPNAAEDKCAEYRDAQNTQDHAMLYGCLPISTHVIASVAALTPQPTPFVMA
jgi:hypothetical protein